MASTFFGISVAQSGLAAQRRALDIIGYNIAHANDPTYKRQRLVSVEGQVLAQAQEGSPLGSSAIGTGVRVSDVERVRDALIENRLRETSNAGAQWEYQTKMLNQLEAALGEPSDQGLQEDLDKFWASWETVATTPDSLPLRRALLEDASALCQRIKFVYSQMDAVQSDLNVAAADKVTQINLIAQELGRLNAEIGMLGSGGVPVNDLLNRRDALVGELSKIVSISQNGEGASDFIISIGGRVLVQGDVVNALAANTDAGGLNQIQWAKDGDPVRVMGGELRAILDLRDTMIPSYMSQMDALAENLITSVNALHLTGTDYDGNAGGEFFKAGTTAANIDLADAIIGHPELIAASGDGARGDSAIASAIAGLKDPKNVVGPTVNQLYRDLVGDIAGSAAIAERQAVAHSLSAEQYITQQQSTSGVSLDEEMANMIKFQQAYNAAARALTVMDEMLGVLIERTGTVGR